MKENREEILTKNAFVPPSIEGVPSEGSAKICAFPSRLDGETQTAKATAKRLKIPFVDPLSADIEPEALALLDLDVAKRRQVVPIRLVHDILLVAMASPEEQIAIRSLELLTGRKIRPAAAPRSSISAALREIKKQRTIEASRDDEKDATAVENEVPTAVENEVPTAVENEVPGEEENKVYTISVISNKGGVGKTHFSINLACSLAKTGASVLLIDADLGSADISNKLGIFPEHHLMDFLEKNRKMEDLVVSTDFGFDLICGTYGEFKLANLYYAQKIKFIKHFKRISQGYDFAVFDLGAGIARTVLDFALGVDSTVIVTTPQDLISGYACAKASFSRFKEVEERLEEKLTDYKPGLAFSPMVVINQVNSSEQGEKLFDTVCDTVDENINSTEGRFRLKPEFLGAIPFDKENLRTTEAKKQPLVVGFPYIKASQCIKHMSSKFCDSGDSYEPKVKFKHGFRRFMAILSQKM